MRQNLSRRVECIRHNRVCWCWLLIGTGVFLWTLEGCERHSEPAPVKVEAVIKPDYLEIYDLTKQEDAAHTIELTGPEGGTWYRRPKPALDLSMIDIEEASVREYVHDEGRYGIMMAVRPEFRDHLTEWSESHIGQYAGVVVQGKLVSTEKIGGKAIPPYLMIRMPSEAVASKVVACIKNSGVDPNHSQAPSRSRPAQTSTDQAGRGAENISDGHESE